MNLGLGVIAGNSFFREQQAQEVRDREAQRFGWEKQRAEAEMGLLPDKTAADRSGYQLRGAQNQAGLETLPGQTENTLAQQRITSTELAGTASRQPTVEATKNVQADVSLANAKAEKEMQPDQITQKKNVAKIAAATSGVDVENLPATLKKMRVDGAISASDVDLTVGAKLYDYIQGGDQNSMIRLLNAQKRASDDPRITGMPDVAAVARAKDANGVEYIVLKDAQGNQIATKPIDQLKAAKDLMTKYEYQKLDEGDSLYRVDSRGNVTLAATAPTTAGGKKAGPMERDVNYLVNTFGMKDTDALAFINQGKTMSKAQFILKAKQDLIAIGDQNKIGPDFEKQMSDMYDRSIEASKPKGSNSSPAPKLPTNPNVKGLLGIP